MVSGERWRGGLAYLGHCGLHGSHTCGQRGRLTLLQLLHWRPHALRRPLLPPPPPPLLSSETQSLPQPARQRGVRE
jgi:hypothetical protein